MTRTTDNRYRDPRNLYPTPPFSSQKQTLPGSEEAMTPKADHGENDYEGTGLLKGRNALITGGDSGIGRAIAIAFAREGANVAFTYLSEDNDARTTASIIRDAGRKALSFRLDQTDRDACDKVVHATVKEFGKIDILINNAAFQQTYRRLSEIPDEDIRKAFETNIEAFFYFTRATLPQMPAGGAIVNTTSIQAYSPSPQLAPYAATKAAIANFTLALAEEAIESGIRVNAVAPGPVWTPLIPTTMPDEKTQKFGKNTLFGRPAQPAELAPIYVFLASPLASYVTGEIYGATGGRMHL